MCASKLHKCVTRFVSDITVILDARGGARRGTTLQKKRAIRLLILIVVAFAVLLLPIHIHLIVGLTIGPLEIEHPWYEVSAWRLYR